MRKSYIYTILMLCILFSAAATFGQSPGGVPGATLWLKADMPGSAYSDGQAMPQWSDASGSGSNATQAVAASQPLYKRNATDNMNYNPVVYASTKSWLAQPYSFSGTYSIMFVDKMRGTASNRVISSTNNNNIVIGQAKGMEDVLQMNNSPKLTTGPTATTNPKLYSFNRATTGVYNMYSAGKSVYAGTTKDASALTVQINGTSPDHSDANITEVIGYPSTITGTQLQQIHTYLAIKYGITMDQTSPTNYIATDGSTVVWDVTANALYKNNIAGLGRDDAEAMKQLQSRSVNSNAIVAIGLGTIAVDNLSNTGAFSSDKSYLTWASNSTAATTQTTNLPTGYPERLTQQWKVQATNFNNATQPVQMQFDLTDITGVTGTTAANFALLIDTDGDGDFTTGTITKVRASSYEGSLVTISNVRELTNGAVFTLVTNFTAPDLYAWFTSGGSTFQMSGSSIVDNRNIVLNVSELNGFATSGTVEIRVTKNANFDLTFDPTATSVNTGIPRAANNADWTMTTTPAYYSFKTTRAIAANGTSKLGINLKVKSVVTSTVSTTVAGTIVTGSGGEVISDNVNNTVSILVSILF